MKALLWACVASCHFLAGFIDVCGPSWGKDRTMRGKQKTYAFFVLEPAAAPSSLNLPGEIGANVTGRLIQLVQ